MQRGVTPEQAQANSSDLQAATNSGIQHDCGSQHKGSKGGFHRGSRRGRRPEGKTNGAPRRDSQGLRPSSGHGRREEGSKSAETSAPDPPLSRSPSTTSSSRPEKFKGISANHLLCFQSHAPQSQGGRSGASSGRSLPRKRFSQPRPQKFDRNKFLQANYRFVVSDAVNASLHYADADRMFEWEDVLQVELLTSAPLSCPISLDNPPRCPQITPCGHIFSFPAIMAHLLHAGGPHLRRSAPCPLCFAPLISRDLRLVSTTSVIPPKVGQPMVFQLLKRGRTTIVPTILGEPQSCQALAGGGAAANTAAADDDDAESGIEGGGGGGSERGGNAKPSNGNVGTGSSTVSKPGKRGSNMAHAKSPAASTMQSGGGPPLAGVATGQLGPLAANCFSKFAVVGLKGAGALWEAAARDLAAYAAEVMAWGGEDAAVEAPSVYAALDVLAVRARRWAEHRAELLLLGPEGTWVPGHAPLRRASASASGSSPQEGCSGLSPEQQGAYAEAQVKKMFVGAVDERALAASLAEAEARQAEEQRAREALFPSLPAGSPPLRQPTQQQQQRGASNGSGLPSGGLNAGAASFSPQGMPSSAAPAAAESKDAARAKGDKSIPGPAHYMPAFSDDGEEEEEEEEEGEEGGGESEHGPAFAAETRTSCGDQTQAALGDKEDGAAGGSSEEGSAGVGGPGRKSDAREGAEGSGGAGGDAGGQGPGAAAMRVADKQVNSATPGGDFYMYQAGDGQWVFMDPLNLKCLLHHYGSYECCPPTITARVLEVESIEQTEATRRRWRFLSHLPLASTFQLAEVALGHSEGGPLPPAALAPFADELGAREKRRRRRAAAERKAAADSAAAAHNAWNARQGPSSAELAAMPTLASAVAGEAQPSAGPGTSSNAQGDIAGSSGGGGQGIALDPQQQGRLAREEAAAAAMALGFASADDLEASVALQASLDERKDQPQPGSSPPPSGSGAPSFAQLARMGFAATGPALGSSPPSSGTVMQAQAAGAWASKSSALRGNSSSSSNTAATPSGQAQRSPGLRQAPFPSANFPSMAASFPGMGAWGSAGPIASAAAGASPQAQPQGNAAPPGAGVWSAGPSFSAAVASQPAPTPTQPTPGKKGGKKGQLLLSTTTQRKY